MARCEERGHLHTSVDQAASQAALLAATEAEAAELRATLAAAEAEGARAKSEAVAQDAELAATADDLRKMIRENQILNEELQRCGAEGERLQHELQQAVSNVTYYEQLAKAKETERQELLGAYKRLGEEATAARAMLQQTGFERERLAAHTASLMRKVPT